MRRDNVKPRNGAQAGAGIDSHQPPRLIGESLPMRALRRTVDRVAATPAPVLVTGQTGSGKELVARRIHASSKRAAGPLVTVNCPALAPELFHAEVFGYEKGAYTGADRRSAGRIEAAEGGTLFLDEIGDLAPEMQVVLLRFLQEGTFERLGSNEPIRADVRVIAATHVDLDAARRSGHFRDDLYYRLHALHVHVPPLCDRGDDIVLLAEYFLANYCRELGLRSHRFTADALEALCQFDWPGNVRQLRHHVLQAVVMCEEAEIGPAELGLSHDPALEDGNRSQTLREARRRAECMAIRRALCTTDGDIEAAAGLLEISRAQLYRLIRANRLGT